MYHPYFFGSLYRLHPVYIIFNINLCLVSDFLSNVIHDIEGAKVDWDFQISDLVKNPDGTDV